MYIKNITIKNYGSIVNFNYDMRFNDSKQPAPLILLGKNGSGKSLLLANIVDALIELKRVNFPQFIPEVKDSNYFKVGKKAYINNKANHSFVNITFLNNGKEHNYSDVMSKNPEKTLQENPELTNYIRDKKYFNDNGFSKNNNFELDNKIFADNIFLYFPVDRYYVPNWFNEENYTKVNYDHDERFIGTSNTNMVKTNVIANIKNWLFNIFLSREIILVPDNNRKYNTSYINSPIQSLILQIINTINNSSSQIPILSYKNNLLPIINEKYSVPDLNNLSSGESMLISIFASILKEYDMNHDTFSFNDIKGIVIIDEIDLNLHINPQRETLPKLIKLFPNIQFIITTHSPFFVNGMKSIFGDNCDFVNLPNGEVTNNLLDFSEVEDAINMFNLDADNLIEYNKDLKQKLLDIAKNHDKILIITEGKTDALLLKKAYEKLNMTKPNIEIMGLDDKVDNLNGDQALYKMLCTLKNIVKKTNSKIIGVFDRDNDNILKKLNPENDISCFVEKNIYALVLPLPDFREGKKISIEHYFKDEDLFLETEDNRRLYKIEEFQESGVNFDNNKICKYLSKQKDFDNISKIRILSGSGPEKVMSFDSKTNYSLSKNDFVEMVCNEIKPFNEIDFSSFKLILDKIDEIVKLMHS